jgi:dTDP-4-amino-4,6-dideoxygalactose transaminase
MTTPAIATSFLPFHRALIGQEEIDAVVEALNSGWLTRGPRVGEFENAFARYVGASHAVALSSCTAALHLAFAAIGLNEGDEVILPTMTFAASGEVVLYFKARPVLVDCDPVTTQIDPEAVETAITAKTRAIMPVHYGGAPCDMARILEIAGRRNLQVIEDAAHALPTEYQGRRIGTIGDITCFSFYATKTLTTGEGGMLTTENTEYAERVRILSLHGISKDAWKRYSAEGSWRYDIIDAGYKYNLTDLQAALGLVQLARCDAMRERRAQIARQYTEAIRAMRAFLPPPFSEAGHAWHLYPLEVNPHALRIDRDYVIEELKSNGIGTSVHFIPLHLHTLYRDKLGYRPGEFPVSEKYWQRTLSLPIYPSMSDGDVGRVLDALHDIEVRFGC